MKKAKRNLLPKAFIAEGFYRRRLLLPKAFIAALMIFVASCGQNASKPTTPASQASQWLLMEKYINIKYL
jgi:hypothetical protein